ncbi:MAG: hypothetical protein IPO92_00290 [Saprospiraceae bacterium]|nr:hypothetical protein [Saprospiraceae bacterium]
MKLYNSNIEKDVKEITALAFSTPNDSLKIHILTALNGVDYPAASAILMFYDPRKFPGGTISIFSTILKLCQSYFRLYT